MKILVLSKRRYMNKDLINDKYGRYYQIPKLLSEKNQDITLVCLDYHSLSFEPPKLIQDGRLYIILHKTGKRLRWLGLLRYIFSVRKYVQALKPDVLIGTSDTIQIIIATYLSNSLNTKLVIDLYDNYESYRQIRLPFIKLLFRNAINKADGIVVITPELGKYINNKYAPKGKIKVIGNAIDDSFIPNIDRFEARKILGLPNKGILVGTAGELSQNRGIGSLIKAFNDIIAENDDFYLVMAGKLEFELPPESMNRIYYLGELEYSKIPVLFAALDVGVICNLDNNFGQYCHPQKACEMLACQLPIVAANVGYLSRIFKNTPGVLFTPDDYQDLKTAILFQAEKKLISKFPVKTWQQQSEALIRLLDTVMNA